MLCLYVLRVSEQKKDTIWMSLRWSLSYQNMWRKCVYVQSVNIWRWCVYMKSVYMWRRCVWRLCIWWPVYKWRQSICEVCVYIWGRYLYSKTVSVESDGNLVYGVRVKNLFMTKQYVVVLVVLDADRFVCMYFVKCCLQKRNVILF